jgi:hypothetical protein
MVNASRGAQVKKSGHTETQQAKIAGEILSGRWLRARQALLVALNRGLRKELSHFPERNAAIFANFVVTLAGLNEGSAALFSEEPRIRDLEEMIAAANQFAGSCTRTGVLAHPVKPDYRLTSQASADKRDALVSDTEDLRHARNDALVAVRRYRLRLEAALKTARRRRRGKKQTVDENGLFGKIAREYRIAFNEEPKSTPGGTFSNIVTHIKAYQTGKSLRDVKNVERIVRAALKTI